MRTAVIFIAALIVSASAAATTYKCVASYDADTKITLDLSTPNDSQAKLVALLSPNAEPTSIGEGTGFVASGVIEYERLGTLGTAKPDQAVLVVTNKDPLIAFFQDPRRVVSVRIDGYPPNARITYYDAWFSPNKVAFGSCK